MNKLEFIESIKDGKWFKYEDDLVKYKYVKGVSIYLWLSYFDTESMCFAEQEDEDWDYIDDAIVDYRAGIYHFGSYEGDKEDSIYDEKSELLVDKMKSIILNSHENKNYQLVTKEELNQAWDDLENNRLEKYEEIKIHF